MVLIFMRKGDVWNCSYYGVVNLFEHGMMVVEGVFGKILYIMVSVVEMQFGFMPERGTIDAVFILRRMQEEYHARGRSCICVL